MKKVFSSTSDLMHAFNLQEQSEGNIPSWNVYFEHNKIYSYGTHYLLAEIYDNGSVWINDKGYSSSTGKHINLVTNATSDRKQYFYSSTNYLAVNSLIKECINKIPRARKNKGWLKEQIVSTYAKYIEFLTDFKLITNHNKLKEHRETVRLYKKFSDNFENLEREIVEQQKRNAELEQKRIKINLSKWRAHEIDWFSNRTKKDYLRISRDLKFVQTSQNVKVPIIEAKRILKLIELKNVIGTKIDDKYLVTACNGIFKAGCHNIEIDEINKIAKKIQKLA